MQIRNECPACQLTNLDSQPAILMPFIANRVFGWDTALIDASWQLNDIPRGNLTFGCKTLYCNNCQTTFLDMGFDDDEMSRLYSGYRSLQYNQMRVMYEPSYALRSAGLNLGYEYLQYVEQHISEHLNSPINSVFDWGGGNGMNTPFKDTASICIYDPSGQATVSGKREVIKSVQLANQCIYDLFVSMNVLEHLPSPLDSLRSVIDLVKADLYYFEVPFEKFALPADPINNSFWKQKRHWHEHINCFTPQSLKLLISNSGLMPLSCAHRIYKNHGRDEHLIACIAVRSH
jgi:hypothetical protein